MSDIADNDTETLRLIPIPIPRFEMLAPNFFDIRICDIKKVCLGSTLTTTSSYFIS